MNKRKQRNFNQGLKWLKDFIQLNMLKQQNYFVPIIVWSILGKFSVFNTYGNYV
jgi:hypothetical protein